MSVKLKTEYHTSDIDTIIHLKSFMPNLESYTFDSIISARYMAYKCANDLLKSTHDQYIIQQNQSGLYNILDGNEENVLLTLSFIKST